MVHCNAYNCLVDSRKRSDKVNDSSCTQPERRITFFSFPKDPVYHRLWVQNMRLENFVVKDHSRLCEKHFEDDQFKVIRHVIESLGSAGKKQIKLKNVAVPTIFDPGSPKSSGQVKGKKTFKRKKLVLQSKLQSKFVCNVNPKKGSPKKRYGAYTKRRRSEVNQFCFINFHGCCNATYGLYHV